MHGVHVDAYGCLCAPLKNTFPNTIQNVFQLFQNSIQVGCCDLKVIQNINYSDGKINKIKGYLDNFEVLKYQSHSFCQTKPVSWNGNIGLFVHPINLITNINPIVNFLKKHTQASAERIDMRKAKKPPMAMFADLVWNLGW